MNSQYLLSDTYWLALRDIKTKISLPPLSSLLCGEKDKQLNQEWWKCTIQRLGWILLEHRKGHLTEKVGKIILPWWVKRWPTGGCAQENRHRVKASDCLWLKQQGRSGVQWAEWQEVKLKIQSDQEALDGTDFIVECMYGTPWKGSLGDVCLVTACRKSMGKRVDGTQGTSRKVLRWPGASARKWLRQWVQGEGAKLKRHSGVKLHVNKEEETESKDGFQDVFSWGDFVVLLIIMTRYLWVEDGF